jgi:hypothetical protein
MKNVRPRDILEVRSRFLREVEIIHKLSEHQHVIHVFASYAFRRELGIILEPVADHGDIAQLLQEVHDSGKRPNESLQAILKRGFGCLASGLTFMHEQSVRHKGISSGLLSNIYARPDLVIIS